MHVAFPSLGLLTSPKLMITTEIAILVRFDFKSLVLRILVQIVRQYKIDLQKLSTIQEYLKIINAGDTQLSFQKLCCPVCISDIDENKQWVAFHPCGHQTCSECFIDLPPASRDSKRCPICYMLISIGVLLAKE